MRNGSQHEYFRKGEEKRVDVGPMTALLEACERRIIHKEKWKNDARKNVGRDNDNSDVTFSLHLGLRSKENTRSWIIR